MSSLKTDSLQLNKWVPTDYVSMSEFNDNFQKIDDAHKDVTTQLAEKPTYNSIFAPTRTSRFIAHRGFNKIAPENTLPAFEHAGRAGFWGVETDLQLTLDGEWVIMHDPTVDRMTNGSGTVTEMTLAQIKNLVIDSGTNISLYKNLRVPTIEELLVVCDRVNIVPVMEVKGVTNQTSASYDKLIDIIRRYGFEEKCIIISFDISALQQIRAKTKKIYIQYLNDIAQSSITAVKELGNAGLDVEVIHATKDLVDWAHTEGILVNVYNAYHQARISQAINAGVDFISTEGQLRG